MRVPAVLAAAAAVATPALGVAVNNESIIVMEAPDHVRPYVLPKFRGKATKLAETQVIRYSITNNSSGGAFALLQHTGNVRGYTSARPHRHHKVQEHFYCSRGRVQLWGMKDEANASHEARVATVGDYGSIPPYGIHTFQLTDPDSSLTHVFHPAGFEHLFEVFSSGDFDTTGISSSFVPAENDNPPFGALTPKEDATLQSLDLYAFYDDAPWIPRRDFVNGTAGDKSLHWHDGPNEIPTDPTLPYFIAKDYGPKYLNEESGYKIIQPLATADITFGKNFTTGTVILSPKSTGDVTVLPNHFGLQMEDGLLELAIKGYEKATLIAGDVAFIPENVEFSYRGMVPFTKFFYMNAGAKGLDYQLLQNSRPWNYTAYPQV